MTKKEATDLILITLLDHANEGAASVHLDMLATDDDKTTLRDLIRIAID